jgi:hypothetical protein
MLLHPLLIIRIYRTFVRLYKIYLLKKTDKKIYSIKIHLPINKTENKTSLKYPQNHLSISKSTKSTKNTTLLIKNSSFLYKS